MRPDTQRSDEVATFGEPACAVEASRRLISRRTLPKPAERRRSLRWNLVSSVAERFGPFLQAKFADAASRFVLGRGAGGSYCRYRPRVGRRRLRQRDHASISSLPRFK